MVWDSSWGMGGVLFINATTPYHQPEAYVELCVGHVIVCAWHYIFAHYHEPSVRDVGSIPQICLLHLLELEHGRTLLFKMQ